MGGHRGAGGADHRFVRGRPDRAAALGHGGQHPNRSRACRDAAAAARGTQLVVSRHAGGQGRPCDCPTWGFLAGGATGQLSALPMHCSAVLWHGAGHRPADFRTSAAGLPDRPRKLRLPAQRIRPEGNELAGGGAGAGIVPFNSAILSNMAGDATREVLIGLDFLAPAPVWPVGQGATALGVLALSCLFGSAGKRYVAALQSRGCSLAGAVLGRAAEAVFWQSGVAGRLFRHSRPPRRTGVRRG